MIRERTSDELQLLAVLKHDPAFRLLIETLTDHVNKLAEELAITHETEKAMRLLRSWQAQTQFLKVMQNAPEQAQNAFQQDVFNDILEPLTTPAPASIAAMLESMRQSQVHQQALMDEL